jgi:hypothetical protein
LAVDEVKEMNHLTQDKARLKKRLSELDFGIGMMKEIAAKTAMLPPLRIALSSTCIGANQRGVEL